MSIVRQYVRRNMQVYMKQFSYSNMVKHCYSSRPVIFIRWIHSNVLGGSAYSKLPNRSYLLLVARSPSATLPKRDLDAKTVPHPISPSLCLSCLSPPRRRSSLHLLGFCQPLVLLSPYSNQSTTPVSCSSFLFSPFLPPSSTKDRVSPVYTRFTSPSDITRGTHVPSPPTDPAVTRIRRDDDSTLRPTSGAATHSIPIPRLVVRRYSNSKQ